MIDFVKTGGGATDAAGREWIERHAGGVHDPIRRPPPTSFSADADVTLGPPAGRLGAFRRRLRDVQVHFLSLVPAAANQRTVLVKSAERHGCLFVEKQVAIAKADATRRMVYGIVYAPDEVDTDGDTVSAAAIEEAAYDFMLRCRTGQIDADHDGIGGRGFVAESWIIRAGDPLFPAEPAGAWAVGIKVTDDATWQRVQRGELRGLSMAGLARAVSGDPYDAAGIASFAKDDLDQANGIITRLRRILGLDAPSAQPFVAPDARATTIEKQHGEGGLIELAHRTEVLDARMAAIERDTAGRQSRLGGPDAAIRKGKGFKGLRIV